jgi:hypothetical protein
MKVQGADILSEITEKTSRNLKAVSSIVIAVKLFNVPVDDLKVLNVDLPGNLFDVVSAVLLAYLMVILVLYWRVDYLLWRDGPILAAKDTLEQYLNGLRHFMSQFEEHAKEHGVPDGGKYIGDHFAGIKAEALEYRRSVATTTWWVWFAIFILHLLFPVTVGVIALMTVAPGMRDVSLRVIQSLCN